MLRPSAPICSEEAGVDDGDPSAHRDPGAEQARGAYPVNGALLGQSETLERGQGDAQPGGPSERSTLNGAEPVPTFLWIKHCLDWAGPVGVGFER